MGYDNKFKLGYVISFRVPSRDSQPENRHPKPRNLPPGRCRGRQTLSQVASTRLTPQDLMPDANVVIYKTKEMIDGEELINERQPVCGWLDCSY